MDRVGLRVGAAVLAAFLIVGAIFARRKLDDKQVEAKGPLRVVCTVEVADACASAASAFLRSEVIIMSGPEIVRALSKAEDADNAPGEVFVTAGPWLDAAAQQRKAAGRTELVDVSKRQLARSPIVIVGYNDRLAALKTWCTKGVLDLACLARAAGAGRWKTLGGSDAWSTVDMGHDDPERSGVGGVVLGAMAVDWFAPTTVSSTDIDDDAFSAAFVALERRSNKAVNGSALSTMLTNIAALETVATTEAEAIRVRTTDKARNGTSVVGTNHVVTVQGGVFTTAARIDDARAVLESPAIQQSLAAAGWRIPPNFAGVDGTALAKGDSLPSPGFLSAITARRKEIVR
jgi:hypothetical protein